jgi:single-stranded DNA-binding protein
MISALVTGDLVGDPVERTTQAGKVFVTATLRVPAGEESVFVGVAAFSETAAARLAQMKRGSSVAAVGVLEVNNWTDREGNARSGWRLTASEVLSPYAATKKRREAEGGDDA